MELKRKASDRLLSSSAVKLINVLSLNTNRAVFKSTFHFDGSATLMVVLVFLRAADHLLSRVDSSFHNGHAYEMERIIVLTGGPLLHGIQLLQTETIVFSIKRIFWVAGFVSLL